MKNQTKKLGQSIVGLKELRENTEKYISRIEKGESFTVIKRSRPIFKISPPESEEMWEEVIDFTQFYENGIPAKELLSRLKKLNA